MRICMIQMKVEMANPDENFKNALKLMNKAMEDKPDVLVFPETLNTGFFPTNLKKYCDKNGKKTKEIFSKFAKENCVNIVAGSVADMRGEKIYNSSYIFDKNGENIVLYDKVHKFSPSGENAIFEGGDGVVNFVVDGVKCSVVICYDLRFCEFIKTAVLKGVDILFIPAQWPLVRNLHWTILNKARAIENQIFICAVNGCGDGNGIKFGGNSLLINPYGEEILHFGENEEVKTAPIDLNILEKIRSEINISSDRRASLYKI